MKSELMAVVLMTMSLLMTLGVQAAESVLGSAGQGSQMLMSPKIKPSRAVFKGKLVDINQATKAELKTLPGIGDTEATKIIAGRPYGSKSWLVTKNVIPAGRYYPIKDRIVALEDKEQDKPVANNQRKAQVKK